MFYLSIRDFGWIRRATIGAFTLVPILVAAYSSGALSAEDNAQLYFDPEISPPAGMPGCVEVQAKINAIRIKDPFLSANPPERTAMARAEELQKKLPAASTAAESVIKAVQQRLSIPLANLRAGGRNSGPECLRSLNLSSQTLIVITIGLSDRYVCNNQACSLASTVTYAVCKNLTCRAEQTSSFALVLSADVFDLRTTNLQGLADQVLQNAFSNLRY